MVILRDIIRIAKLARNLSKSGFHPEDAASFHLYIKTLILGIFLQSPEIKSTKSHRTILNLNINCAMELFFLTEAISIAIE